MTFEQSSKYEYISVRILSETKKKIDKIAFATGRFRNEVINTLLQFGVENCEIEEKNKQPIENPCKECGRKPYCPGVCYPRRDYERALKKKGK